jgi:hypothetical protein
MGNSIRDAQISTPRMVSDIVTRVVVEGRKTALWLEPWRRPMYPTVRSNGYPNQEEIECSKKR